MFVTVTVTAIVSFSFGVTFSVSVSVTVTAVAMFSVGVTFSVSVSVTVTVSVNQHLVILEFTIM